MSITPKLDLYQDGVRKATAFFNLNKISLPHFYTFEEIFATGENTPISRTLRRMRNGPLQGTATGYYKNNTIYVHLQKSANMVLYGHHMAWSHPGYKIDRTPTGVVAHESGHHLDSVLKSRRGLYPSDLEIWEKVLDISKRVSGYEPIPSEAFAETMRLFILNPDLLLQGSPQRYHFVTSFGIIPSETRDFKTVLNNIPSFVSAAENWIAQSK
jgi:hypothetical protein